MKSFAATVAAAVTTVAMLAAPAFAADIVKDSSGAYSCQKRGEVISYYNPYGRVPTVKEQVQCKQLGGAIVNPKPKTKHERMPEGRHVAP